MSGSLLNRFLNRLDQSIKGAGFSSWSVGVSCAVHLSLLLMVVLFNNDNRIYKPFMVRGIHSRNVLPVQWTLPRAKSSLSGCSAGSMSGASSAASRGTATGKGRKPLVGKGKKRAQKIVQKKSKANKSVQKPSPQAAQARAAQGTHLAEEAAKKSAAKQSKKSKKKTKLAPPTVLPDSKEQKAGVVEKPIQQNKEQPKPVEKPRQAVQQEAKKIEPEKKVPEPVVKEVEQEVAVPEVVKEDAQSEQTEMPLEENSNVTEVSDQPHDGGAAGAGVATGSDEAPNVLHYDFTGHVDRDMMILQLEIQEEIERVWQPPVGVPQGTTTQARLTIDSHGVVSDVEIIQSSPVQIYDMSVIRDAHRFSFSHKGLWGKTIDVTFRQ